MQQDLSVWEIVEKLREKKGISKKILSDKLKMNYNYLVDLLNGRYHTKIDNEAMQSISTALKIPLNKLLEAFQGADIDTILLPEQIPPPPQETLTQSPITKEDKPITEEPITTPYAPTPSLRGGSPCGASISKIVPLGTRTPLFRIISGSKIDLSFNRPELWQSEIVSGNEFISLPSHSAEVGQDIAQHEVIAVQLEDYSLFPPCLSGSIFIVSLKNEPRIGDLVLLVLRNYRAWIIELNKMETDTVTFRPYNTTYEAIMVAQPDILGMYPIIWIKLS
jgi:transcriptional regulator with XRE-family HTH domain